MRRNTCLAIACGVIAGALASTPAWAQPRKHAGRRAAAALIPPHWPRLVLGFDAGFGLFTEGGPLRFGTGVGSVTYYGPTWGGRVGVDLLPWLGVEGRYIGAFNKVNALVNDPGVLGLLTNGGAAVLRVTIPTPYVQPYFFGGVGGFHSSVVRTAAAPANTPATALVDSSMLGIPIGVGLDVLTSNNTSVGVEATYNLFINEHFTTNPNISGGDLLTINAVFRYRL